MQSAAVGWGSPVSESFGGTDGVGGQAASRNPHSIFYPLGSFLRLSRSPGIKCVPVLSFGLPGQRETPALEAPSLCFHPWPRLRGRRALLPCRVVTCAGGRSSGNSTACVCVPSCFLKQPLVTLRGFQRLRRKVLLSQCREVWSGGGTWQGSDFTPLQGGGKVPAKSAVFGGGREVCPAPRRR